MGATFVLVLTLKNPSSVWIKELVILNVILFLAPRFVLLSGGFLRALKATSHHQMDPTRADADTTPISAQLPMTLVIIPCYQESLASVLASVNSVAHSVYTHNQIHIFLSFDGPQNMDVYSQFVNTVGARKNTSRRSPCAEISIGNARLTVCIFEHGGKRRCQAHTMDYMKQYHDEYFQNVPNTCILLLDADTTIDRWTLQLLATRVVSTDVNVANNAHLKAAVSFIDEYRKCRRCIMPAGHFSSIIVSPSSHSGRRISPARRPVRS